MAKAQTTGKVKKAAPTAVQQQALDLEFNRSLFPTNVKKAMSELGGSKRDFYMLPLSSLTILELFNVRVHNAAWHARVRTIANSMKRDGFKQDKPISTIAVTKDGKTLNHPYDGHTRLAAVALANKELAEEGKPLIEEVPTKPAPMGTTLEDITNNLVTGNMGAPLEPFEVAIVCKRKVGYGSTVEQIAIDLDLTVGYVNDLLLLMGSPKAIRDMVQNDQVSASEAITALKKHEDRALEHLQRALARAQADGKTRATGKYMPGHIYNRAVKTQTPGMVHAIKELKKDAGYQGLKPENQKILDEILAALSAAEEQESAAAPQAEIKEQEQPAAMAA
jgi:ParB family chromosome partitioning protein